MGALLWMGKSERPFRDGKVELTTQPGGNSKAKALRQEMTCPLPET